MIRTRVRVDQVVRRLNRLVERDPDGMKAMCEARAPVAAALADEQDLPVLVLKDGEDTRYLLGPLGLVNYLFGIDADTGMGPVAGIFEVACSRCGLLGSDEQVVGGSCGACGGPLELGDLLRFGVTPQGLAALEKDEAG